MLFQASTASLAGKVICRYGRFVLATGVCTAAAFADLYHGRWRIEEAYKRVKHRLQLEHTSVSMAVKNCR